MDLKKQILTALGLDKEVQLEFNDKLTDGTIVVSEAEELEAGISISILTEDGTTIPLPVGQYELQDGQGFSVEEEGIVAEVYESETEEEEEEEVVEEVEAGEEARQPKKIKETKEVEFDKVAFIDEVKSVVNELVAKTKSDIEKLQSEIDELKETNGNLETEKEELSSQVEKLSKEPADKPVTTNKFAEKKELSKVDYKKLSRQEKYWYNINNLKN